MQARMDYCGPRGIELDAFLRWSERSQDVALQWQQRENQRCRGCGTHPHEWNPAAGGSRHAYVARLAVCPGCMARDGMAASDEAKNAGHGTRVALYPSE